MAEEPTAIIQTFGDCRYCDRRHGARYLCDPAKKVLDALLEQGTQFDMPTVEFPQMKQATADMLGPGTVLVRQFIVKAALVPVAGVPKPSLLFTGRDVTNAELPHWVYPGDERDMKRAVKLVSDMAEMAVRRARRERGY